MAATERMLSADSPARPAARAAGHAEHGHGQLAVSLDGRARERRRVVEGPVVFEAAAHGAWLRITANVFGKILGQYGAGAFAIFVVEPSEIDRLTPAGERFRILNNFVDFTLAELSRAEIAVWLVLYRDTRDGTARTSMVDLARRAGCSRRAVVTAVKALEKLGLIKIVHRGGIRRGPSRYCVRSLVKDA